MRLDASSNIKTQFDKHCHFRLCQFKHIVNSEHIEEIGNASKNTKEFEGIEEIETAQEDYVVDVDCEESENEYEEIKDDSITDDENFDYEPVNIAVLEENKDCNGCSRQMKKGLVKRTLGHLFM